VVIYVLLKHVMPSLTALVIATLLPLIENAIHIWKKRSMDTFGLLMLSSFVLAAALALLSGSERLVLVRESIVTAALGCWFLMSLLFRRPLIYQMAQRFVGEEKASIYKQNWRNPYVRFVFRLMTAVWGVMLLLEAGIRVVLAYKLSTTEFLAVSHVIFYGVLAVTIGWTVVYRKHVKRKLQQI
jgi:intracellular septation protein A